VAGHAGFRDFAERPFVEESGRPDRASTIFEERSDIASSQPRIE
jgi:hypothetical protein